MRGSTNWDALVCGDELARIKLLRSKSYVESKERRAALPELEEEGWQVSKFYKDPKFIGVRKEKRFDEQFEDRLWSLFARLGFTHLNRDRHFEMSYDPQNPDIRQQIDVFASDGETVLIAECKAAASPRDGFFKKPLEAFHSQMDGLRQEARRRFPSAQVKFIWATQNYVVSTQDRAKMREWGIVHFSDAVIHYYYELSRHLGSCARYQLLGNLFARQEIQNMEDRVPAIQGTMGGHTYFFFSIEPERLLKIGYVLHRNEAHQAMMPTYQRLIKKKRLSTIQQFVRDGGYFPNSLIVSIDSHGTPLRFDPASPQAKNGCSQLGTLYLPKRYRSAYIIDGQHRLYAYSDSSCAKTDHLPVIAFVDLDRREQVKLFMDINENQKAVSKTLRVTLHADMLWDSNDYNDRRQAIRSRIAQMLGEEETSPLRGRIVIGEEEKSPRKCITVEAIQTALKRCGFLSQFSKKNAIVKDGTFDTGTNQSTCELLYAFLEGCLRYVRDGAPEEWARGDGSDGMLTINRGIQAVIRVLNDIVNLLTARGDISPKSQRPEELVRQVSFYLDPLNEYLAHLSPQERKSLRGYFGGGADTRFWRAFQREIARARSDFRPAGLAEYWESEISACHEDSQICLRAAVCYVKDTVRTALRQKYGQNWEVLGLPKAIYKRAKSEADLKNYDLVAAGGTREAVSIWDCVTLKECRDVVIAGSHWAELFDTALTRPEERRLSGGKIAKTRWMERMDTLQNKLRLPSARITPADLHLLQAVYLWIQEISGGTAAS